MPDDKFVTHELPELTTLIREATRQVEDELELEDRGWIRGGASTEIISDIARTDAVTLSRLYWAKDH